MATVWNAEGVDFSNFNPVTADYGPRDLHAEAAMVTELNIGQWALEFEKDLAGQLNNDPFFAIEAEREGDVPITLTIKPGFWIVKVWNELHLFKDGLFQNTFDVSREQLALVRKAYRDKLIAREREWAKAREEVFSVAEQEFEEKLEQAMASGDWSNLEPTEKMILKQRLKEDEELQTYVEAARLMKSAEKTQIVPAVGELDTTDANGKLD